MRAAYPRTCSSPSSDADQQRVFVGEGSAKRSVVDLSGFREG